MDTNDLVIKILAEAGEPLKGGEIAQKAGVDKKIVDKAIKKLKEDGKIISPKRCFYSLP